MYALNTKKGTTIQNEDVGELQGGIAIPITDKQSLIAKHLINVVVFDRVAGVVKHKEEQKLYGISEDTMLKDSDEVKKYTEFVAQYKNLKIAADKWKEYKKALKR